MTSKPKPATTNYGAYFGTAPGSVEALRDAIMDILQSGAEQETLRCALTVLREGATVKDITISNSTFISGQQ